MKSGNTEISFAITAANEFNMCIICSPCTPCTSSLKVKISCFSEFDSSTRALLSELVAEGKNITEDLYFGGKNVWLEKMHEGVKVTNNIIINGLRHRTKRIKRLVDSRYADSLTF